MKTIDQLWFRVDIDVRSSRNGCHNSYYNCISDAWIDRDTKEIIKMQTNF